MRLDLVGKVFGKLTVIEYVGNDKNHKTKWRCRCECGGETISLGSNLTKGGATSCGCVGRERIKNLRRTHGKYQSPEHISWHSMLSRCNNPNYKQFKDYGGRGITVCERWSKFENFLVDMGERPEGTTLERIDNNGNYEPSNCRWATHQEQRRNASNVVMVEGMCLKDWAETLGLNYSTVKSRYRRTGKIM